MCGIVEIFNYYKGETIDEKVLVKIGDTMIYSGQYWLLL